MITKELKFTKESRSSYYDINLNNSTNLYIKVYLNKLYPDGNIKGIKNNKRYLSFYAFNVLNVCLKFDNNIHLRPIPTKINNMLRF